MKVRLIKIKSIEDFVYKNARSRSSFSIWLTLIKQADWNIPEDIFKTFGFADLIGQGTNRVVFNIGGNHSRLICKYHFGITKVHLFVKWIGSHNQYTQLWNKNEQYSVNSF